MFYGKRLHAKLSIPNDAIFSTRVSQYKNFGKFAKLAVGRMKEGNTDVSPPPFLLPKTLTFYGATQHFGVAVVMPNKQ